MGALSQTYLGIYLEVEHTEETVTSTHFVDSSGKIAKSRFNPETGEENKEVTKEEVKQVYSNLNNLIVDGFDESEFFGPANGSYNKFTSWIPNNRMFQLARFDEQDESKCIELEDIDVESIKEHFCRHYDAYLKVLGKKFNYKVKFGIIHYYH